ncbi:MAG: 30S ribosome-binding factor RbfA [Anaerolineae bacterium]|jgi:ribosome-binding factor A|nr:30S ribosome-binding factor RbfA [Anaerolineae bacterium]MDH7474291.1 30S ribosome-binding factor RbfA [Anaerolineae bacterium]
MSKRRQKRVGEAIHHELSDLLLRRSRDPRLQAVTITDVRISSDLRYARVYVTTRGDSEERKLALQAVQHATGYLRGELASRLSLRFVPELAFFLDESLDHYDHIESLLVEIGTESEVGESSDKASDLQPE